MVVLVLRCMLSISERAVFSEHEWTADWLLDSHSVKYVCALK